MKTFGNGAQCANCNKEATGRWQLANVAIIWACSIDCAELVKWNLWERQPSQDVTR